MSLSMNSRESFEVHEAGAARAAGIEDFINTHSRALLRSAWLLTGNWASAEDLVQTALVVAWQRWNSIEADDPMAYVRRVLVNAYLRGQRRRWTLERPVAEVPDQETVDETSASDVRASVRAALAQLPPKQRAVVVLRYFNDMSEAQTASALGCSIGNVKSQSSRALAKLRSAPGLQGLLEEATHG